MTNQAKTIFSIIALVTIGFLAGYHTHRYTVRTHLNKIAKERISPGLQERMIHALELDEAQKEKVTPILENYGKQLIQLRREEVAKRKPLLDSLQVELSKSLRPDQMERLDRMMHRMKRMRENGRKKKGREKRRE